MTIRVELVIKINHSGEQIFFAIQHIMCVAVKEGRIGSGRFTVKANAQGNEIS